MRLKKDLMEFIFLIGLMIVILQVDIQDKEGNIITRQKHTLTLKEKQKRGLLETPVGTQLLVLYLTTLMI